MRKYLEQYKKVFKDREVYLFSSLPDDESPDDIEPKRIRLDSSIYEDPLSIEAFANSVIIVDDIDVLSNKQIRNAVYDLLSQVLEIGRHFKITCLMTNHLPSNRTDTRRILNECHVFIYVPRSSSAKIKHVLQEYIGLGKNQIAEFKKKNSRWIAIIKNFPGNFIAEHCLGLLDMQDD